MDTGLGMQDGQTDFWVLDARCTMHEMHHCCGLGCEELLKGDRIIAPATIDQTQTPEREEFYIRNPSKIVGRTHNRDIMI